MMHRATSVLFCGLGLWLTGCAPEATVGQPDASPSASLFGHTVTSFAHLGEAGEILGVGVTIPAQAFADAPTSHGFQNDLVLEMPANVRDKTFIQELRVNWLASGHGPTHYGAPHFDLHFFRGEAEEIEAIDCSDTSAFPPAVLSADYDTPTTCVSGMGYHAWPSEDAKTGVFTASMILGYYAKKMVFIEPMVTQALLLERKSFERTIARPASAGGSTTLYPAHFTAAYDAASDAYRLEFDEFASID